MAGSKGKKTKKQVDSVESVFDQFDEELSMSISLALERLAGLYRDSGENWSDIADAMEEITAIMRARTGGK
ncbi:hypothetical protein N9L26_00910 [Candidatus Pacebacteria bacterium]|nr:hypothetical protein [Candidatus Paceibacterota bacterium]